MYNFSAEHCMAVVLAPYRQPNFELMKWLELIGIPHVELNAALVPNIAEACNISIRDFALPSTASQFIFADGDIAPFLFNRPKSIERMQPFLDATDDLVSVEYKGDGDFNMMWGAATAFHCALHRCSRDVLRTLRETCPPNGVPWHNWILTNEGCDNEDFCDYFRDRVLDAGFSVSHAGFAHHIPGSKKRGCSYL